MSVRFITAASLFDGHDAAINIMRRILQASGAEVIHLGHNRSVRDIVRAAVQEDAQGIAISSYQGGHVRFFKYAVDMLKEMDCSHIKVYGGGGGVIVQQEIEELHAYGVARIFSPQDGTSLGLQGMIDHMMQTVDAKAPSKPFSDMAEGLRRGEERSLARAISLAERMKEDGQAVPELEALLEDGRKASVPIIGITGTGGAGKSSLTDEMVRRFLVNYPDCRIGVLSVDPTKRRTGGSLLGDRIRMNSLSSERTFMRSLATHGSGSELAPATEEALQLMKAAGFDLLILETSGIGQGESAVVDLVDVSVYVMTSEYGAASQLEKIDMLDYADLVALNKFEKRGSTDALRDVRKQVRRARQISWDVPEEKIPVYGTIASRFNCNGTNWFFDRLMETVRQKTDFPHAHEPTATEETVVSDEIIPGTRSNYLGEIADTLRRYKRFTAEEATRLRERHHLLEAQRLLGEGGTAALGERIAEVDKALSADSLRALEDYEGLRRRYQGESFDYQVRGKTLTQSLVTQSLSGTLVPRVALPEYHDPGDLYSFLRLENLPGYFPYTAGVFPFKRQGEDPARMFAGEGPPARTNARFQFLSRDSEAKRLSTAFDSVTLYGEDPDPRPDIYGKVGESGVSICTLEDMKILYGGFDLVSPLCSVSMTINGPAPMILAMYLNTAISFETDRFRAEKGREPDEAEAAEIETRTLNSVRGTVQADILKEDQAQNTCIFSTEFALRMMGDMQEYFIQRGIRNYYSVSISGYHIAEAGANPISQLAFTLANGFTYVEYYLARGMRIDDFAPNLSFFFSNGLDPEYSVIGRVARRIWAVAMRDIYGANERSQKLKYHIQTSGRSLHAQEMAFNDIRTTLQALLAINDNCNSLHTNAYDEAVTTPTRESVRRALAIQMIINREYGATKNENPAQGSFIMRELTELVEEAVLDEFVRISERGGVLGAMETQYQRGKIQEESMYYELRKESGELPIIGVNTFIDPEGQAVPEDIELARATEEEKQGQVAALKAFQDTHGEKATQALSRLQQTAREGGNLFAELMQTVRVASLGQITNALFEVGGQYRRNM